MISLAKQARATRPHAYARTHKQRIVGCIKFARISSLFSHFWPTLASHSIRQWPRFGSTYTLTLTAYKQQCAQHTVPWSHSHRNWLITFFVFGNETKRRWNRIFKIKIKTLWVVVATLADLILYKWARNQAKGIHYTQMILLTMALRIAYTIYRLGSFCHQFAYELTSNREQRAREWIWIWTNEPTEPVPFSMLCAVLKKVWAQYVSPTL